MKMVPRWMCREVVNQFRCANEGRGPLEAGRGAGDKSADLIIRRRAKRRRELQKCGVTVNRNVHQKKKKIPWKLKELGEANFRRLIMGVADETRGDARSGRIFGDNPIIRNPNQGRRREEGDEKDSGLMVQKFGELCGICGAAVPSNIGKRIKPSGVTADRGECFRDARRLIGGCGSVVGKESQRRFCTAIDPERGLYAQPEADMGDEEEEFQRKEVMTEDWWTSGHNTTGER
ncbi:hypothetical protein CPB86DRAFT_795182 [Serendipita vermifera]|nr:hypothetical protein CPB86DRAFT_795182 [Serendipita vermifera]